VELTADGGGKVPALTRSLRGLNRVARTLINWIRPGARLPGVSLRPVEVNGARSLPAGWLAVMGVA
jgi:RNA polymerase sigma-70 factor (ECF subfamily)